MMIRRMTIRNFGKIHDRTFELSPGINVLYGENESGKTTLHTFMRSMFYGVQRLRGRAAKTDVYSTYEPWENPREYGGVIWFTRGNEDFRLTRNFYKERPYHELLSETTGAITDAEQGSLARVLGVSSAVYDNTVSVGQLKSVTGQDLVRELQNYMASYEGTADGSIDLVRATQVLKMSRKGYQVQEDRRQKEILRQQEEISAQAGYLQKEIDSLYKKRNVLDEKSKGLRMDSGGEEILTRRIQQVKEQKKKNSILFLGLFALCIAAALLIPGLPLAARILLGVVSAVMLGAGAWKNSILTKELNRREKLKKKWLTKQEKVLWGRRESDTGIAEKKADHAALQEAYQECEEQKYLRSHEAVEAEALTLALETIEDLSGNIVNQVSQGLRTRTSEILCEITGGKYSQVLMDENLHMSVNTEERVIPLERLSRGTLEQIYFALRMAAGELLCGPEPFPVILDDVFGMYDEERLAGVLAWLYQEKRQIIISTCNKREMEILEKQGIPFQRLEL